MELLALPKIRRSCFDRWHCYVDADDRGGNDDADDATDAADAARVRGLRLSSHRFLDFLTELRRPVSKRAGGQ